MKIRISATVPVVQYGNIVPEFEEDVPPELVEETLAKLEERLRDFWSRYAEVGKQLPTRGKRLKAFIGGEIFFDEPTHTYTNELGEVYLSASQYAKSLEAPFDSQLISGAIAKKFNADAADILAMWKLKGEVSSGFGKAIHAALELYGRYDGLAKQLEKTTHLHDHPVIKQAVTGFFAGREDEKAMYEAVVVDHTNKKVGCIDRLLVIDRKRCRIQDFKTNASIEKSLPTYWAQLGFYKEIVEAGGWVVEGLDIFHWNGEWHEYKQDKGV